MAQGSDDFVYVEIDDDDPTIIIYTSGTTAMPKGVEITYQDLTVYVTNTMAPADPEADYDKTLLSVPLFHIAGATAMLSAIWGGRTLVILPQFTPEEWMQAVDGHGVTHSMIVPTMLRRVMDHQDFGDFKGDSLKLVAYGAAPMPYEVVRKAIDVFRLRPDERLRPDRVHLCDHLPGTRRPSAGRHARGGRDQGTSSALRGQSHG